MLRDPMPFAYKSLVFTEKMEHLQIISNNISSSSSSSSSSKYSGCIQSQKEALTRCAYMFSVFCMAVSAWLAKVHVWQWGSVYRKLSRGQCWQKAHKSVRQNREAQSVVMFFTQKGDSKQVCRRKAQNYTVCETHKQIAWMQKTDQTSTETS